MGFGSDDDNDNDLPDWLKGLQSEDNNGGLDSEGGFLPKEDDVPDWLEDEDEGGFSIPEAHAEESEEEVPDWLAKIRDEEQVEKSPFASEPEEEESADDDIWLKNIQEQYRRDHGDEQPEEEAEETHEDYMARIRALKEEDTQAPDLWGDDEEDSGSGEVDHDPVAAAWEADTGTLAPMEDDEDEVPDWVTGLPTVDPEDQKAFTAPPSEEDDETPPWLREIRTKTTEETRPPDDVLPEFGLKPEDMYQETPAEDEEAPAPEEEAEEETPQAGPAFSERPAVTGSLPSWLEDLQTSGQIEPFDSDDDEEQEAPVYSEEDVSALFGQDDLPDWLQPEEEETPAEAPQVSAMSEGIGEPESLEKAELPTWLQAMRPVEAVTADLPDEPEETDDAEEKKKETIGPLSGLSDVLPAEPHIVHFGNKPRPAARFELTEPQKKYAQLLKSLVDNEASYTPVDTRKVANPQQVLRWVIAILLLTLLFAVVWLNGDFIPLPAQGFPEENLAVVSMVNELQASDKVLVAFEYQPGLAGEMEAASSALIEHLLLRESQLVLVSTQPVGPGLAEVFLQSQYQNSAYVVQKGYANLGYVAGGTAGLLTFASNPRQAKPHMAWNTAPLDSITFIRDFSMVVVITDDPDIARSWIEQVQPLLAAPPGGEQIPLVMVTSAQAEPLVYPYYLSEPRQVSGMVSGLSGGAYYETVIDPSLSRRYWDGYNVGLIVAVLVIAVGSIINLTRNSLKGLPGGRS